MSNRFADGRVDPRPAAASAVLHPAYRWRRVPRRTGQRVEADGTPAANKAATVKKSKTAVRFARVAGDVEGRGEEHRAAGPMQIIQRLEVA